ncbi:T9SS type A sorting domain-containing protein [Pseudotamlana carrageenivorans]|uniref:Secretion system C-terminal sorting domain-containing protein n=1 Tax=Pseudotamlana carrageenivorans TaxID=2069432 RepID=A0A2I7SMF1_9FLAO|nr:T9SS type A sorting domain-containing protein [Tamlana carrageenivorans]AUS07067.1 hypothetical protein C1A40_17180 [Tamlana carrageenivorans]
MKMKILLLVTLIGIISSNNLNAQEVCGTTTPANYQDYSTVNNKSTNDEAICINIYFHIVRETNGSGGINPNQLDNIVNNLNLFYNVFDIYFSNIGFDYINNSNYVQVSESEANALGQINNQSNAINYYIVDALWNTGGGFVTGTALSIPSNRLIIRNDRVLSSTSPHEVGHCLNLLHTFETYYCAEAINGSNCSSCGDLVCDTPADANTGNSGGYSPDLTNIMSYYSNRDHFTDGQSIRMKSAILSNSLLQQVVGTSCLVPEINGQETICNSSGTTYTLSNGGSSVAWNVSSNLIINSQNTTSITVTPISTSTNGAAFIEAILPTQTIRKDIWIGKPNFNVSRVSAQEESCDNKYHYVKFVVSNRQPNETYNFFVVPIPGMTHGWGNNDRYVFQIPKNYSSYLEFSVKGTNSCGWKTVFTEAEIYPCGSYSKTSDNIIIYPNPANEKLEIEFENVPENEQSVIIYDYFSNIIFEKRNKKNKKLSINTGNFKNGLYILQINNEIETITKQFIIQH